MFFNTIHGLCQMTGFSPKFVFAILFAMIYAVARTLSWFYDKFTQSSSYYKFQEQTVADHKGKEMQYYAKRWGVNLIHVFMTVDAFICIIFFYLTIATLGIAILT